MTSKFIDFDPETSTIFHGAVNFASGQNPRVMYLNGYQQKKISLDLTGGTDGSTFSHFSLMLSGEGAFLSYRINDEEGHTEESLHWEGEALALAIENIINKLDDEGVADWINVSIMTSVL